MQRFYFLLFFLITNIAAQAQGLPGYVLTLTGDTLRGAVVEQSIHQIIFYSKPGAQPQYFRPSQVQAYSTGTSTPYSSRVVRLHSGTDSMCFVRPILIGPASLYSYAVDSVRYMLAPASSNTLYELTALNWHLLFSRYLGNCSSLDMTDKEVVQLPFEQRRIRNLLNRYNKCIDPSWKPDHRQISSGQPSLVVQAGATLSTLIDQTKEYATDANLQPGALISLELRQNYSSGWWIGAGVLLQQLRGSLRPYPVYSGTTLYTSSITESYRLNNIALSGSVGKRFRQPGTIRPYVFASIAGGTFLNSYYRARQENSNPTFPPPAEVYTDYSGKLSLQAIVGVGTTFPINNHRDLQVGLHYGQNALLLFSPTRRVNVFALQAGYVISKAR